MVDFVIIGAMKSGTSTIYESLKNQSGLSFTQKKEANFFNHEITSSTLVKYKESFLSETGMRGDISPNYARRHFFPDVAKSIAQWSPECKIIYIVRDPIKRIISHLHHDMLRDRIGGHESISKILRQNKDYIQTSSYNYQIKSYEQLFDVSQIWVVSFEDIIADFDKFAQQLARFLGFELTGKIPLVEGNISNARYYIRYHDWFHRHFKNRLLTKCYHWFWYFRGIAVQRPELQYDDLIWLRNELEEDIKTFCAKYRNVDKNWNLFKVGSPNL